MDIPEWVYAFIEQCLDDDDGINENAYSTLCDHLDIPRVAEVHSRIRSADGRYYLPENND